jgi:catechol 2,3-dioxygenase-like lactoylglutathione lyase family enzyme
VEILGLVFAGTATDRRAAMARFVEVTLGLRREAGADSGVSADMFALPDGTRFAVADARDERGGTSRTIGFLVADLDAAVTELRAAGVEVDEPAGNDRHRYAHFIAPDGELYEVVQELIQP